MIGAAARRTLDPRTVRLSDPSTPPPDASVGVRRGRRGRSEGAGDFPVLGVAEPFSAAAAQATRPAENTPRPPMWFVACTSGLAPPPCARGRRARTPAPRARSDRDSAVYAAAPRRWSAAPLQADRPNPAPRRTFTRAVPAARTTGSFGGGTTSAVDGLCDARRRSGTPARFSESRRQACGRGRQTTRHRAASTPGRRGTPGPAPARPARFSPSTGGFLPALTGGGGNGPASVARAAPAAGRIPARIAAAVDGRTPSSCAQLQVAPHFGTASCRCLTRR